MSEKRKRSRRALKFWVLNWLVLPGGLLILRLLVSTWRLDKRGVEDLRRLLQEHDRLLIASWHGMSIGLMPYARIARSLGRQVCVMTSPSRDGQVMDKAVGAIGLRVVKGSSRSRASAGSLALVNEIAAGTVALMAVDGPRGPVTVPKPGIIRLARASQAHLVTVAVGSSHSLRFRSWDRLFLPLPLARVFIRITPFPIPGPEEPEAEGLEAMRKQLLRDAGTVACPIASRRAG